MKAILRALLVCLTATPAFAADIKVIATNNMRAILTDIAALHRKSTNDRAELVFDTGGSIMRRLVAGESFDVVVTQPGQRDELAAKGIVDRAGAVDFARSSIDVIVRAGAPRPDLSSSTTFRDALLAAKAIAYTDPASGGLVGTYFAEVLGRLGIAETIRARTRLAPPPGAVVGEMVADGRAEIGINQKAELIAVKGIDFAGELPMELRRNIIVTGAMLVATKQREAATAFLAFLRGPGAAAPIRAGGMEPR